MNNLAISNFTFGLSDLSRHQEDSARSIERLSTGNQVNRASDNPSGVQSATRLQARENAIIKQLEGFERERGFLGTQEGALSVIADQLIELNAIVVQSADGATLTDDERTALTDQARSLIEGIDFIASSTTFNNQPALTGFSASLLASGSRRVTDPETGEEVTEQVTLSDIAELLTQDPELAQELAKDAASRVSNRRAAIGAREIDLDSRARALSAELENTAEARSLIEDTDYAKETAELARSQLLEQATIEAIKIQRASVESIMTLLEPIEAAQPS